MNEDATGRAAVPGPARRPRRTRPQGDANRRWWPERLNLKILAKNQPVLNPLGADFDYAAAFETLDLGAVKADIAAVLDTTARTGGPPTSATTAR